ncbi:MAG: NAD+ synthase [Planctomycetota bacterium]
MRIALAQINPTVGDIAGNAEKIRRRLAQARDAGADLAVFPELTILGYPPKDLLLKPDVIDRARAAVEHLAEDTAGLTALIGLPVWSEHGRGRTLHNAAAVCVDGKIASFHHKALLPTYDVFDELRYFEPGPTTRLTDLTARDGQTIKLGLSICEDLWGAAEHFDRRLYHVDPIAALADAGAELFVNLSASPFIAGKHPKRRAIMGELAKKHGLPVLFCNQVGGNDELVFDGRSCVFNGSGALVAEAAGFEEDLLVVDIEGPTSGVEVRLPGFGERQAATTPKPDETEAEVHAALVLGLRDYVRKCGFKSVVLGLSGGIDSAVTAAVAVAALGPEAVRGVALPSRYSSGGSVDDAQALADALDIAFHVVPIETPHAAMEATVTPLFDEILGDHQPGVTEENIQARLRGNLLMALSNKTGAMLVTTGNKSELAVGYCTLYGDMCGGFSVLSDVPKLLVYRLARWINDAPDSPLRQQFGRGVIPEGTITKPPSAELRPDQKDQDSLPPYEQLDEIIERYVEREQSAATILAETGFDADVVLRIVRLIDLNEYKRKQAAPGLKITGRAFGFGRRMPIAQRYDPRHGVG